MYKDNDFLFISNNIKKPIVLIGLMGCGKTTVGIRLAKKLNWQFIDTDSEIEKQVGCSISTIFKYGGENFFRAAEYKIIQQFISSNNCIIATGGGAFINKDTRELIDQFGISVWLKASFDILLERVSRRKNRPILEEGDKQKILQELLTQRYPIYEGANITVNSDHHPHDIIVESIIRKLKDYL